MILSISKEDMRDLKKKLRTLGGMIEKVSSEKEIQKFKLKVG